jgi:hypothetical protein
MVRYTVSAYAADFESMSVTTFCMPEVLAFTDADMFVAGISWQKLKGHHRKIAFATSVSGLMPRPWVTPYLGEGSQASISVGEFEVGQTAGGPCGRRVRGKGSVLNLLLTLYVLRT